jgi:hypothetical protein
MNLHRAHAATLFAIVVIAAQLTPSPVAGQGTSPRLSDGTPNLQGIWDFGTVTPLLRPAALGDQAFLSAEQAAEFEAQRAAAAQVEVAPRPGDPGAYNQFWFDRGSAVVGTRRTSLIVDPPNGQLPDYTAEGRARRAARVAARERNAGPEDRDIDERCILGFNSGPPMIPGAYNNLVHIFQAPGYVVVMNEMVNDVRVIPLDGRDPIPSHIQQWRGDSRGRWEGETLVVETRNFRDIGTAHPAPNMERLEALGPNMHLIERFTRPDDGILRYEFTVNDPTAFTQPWSAEMTMARTEDTLFEYACHEGNYGLYNILAGAQAEARQQ